jgi:hypothetical protein
VTLALYVGQFLGVSMAEARRENTPLGTPPVVPPIPDGARAPAIPPNPDPKKLRWDADKRAFRFIHPPTRCTCGGAQSMLTGEKLTCGLCDGRAKPPARFQPGPVYDPCHYCGTTGQGHVCPRCRAIKARLVASGITDDDQLLVEIQRALNAAERQAQRREDIDAVKARRAANRRRRERRWVKDAPATIAGAPAP